MNKQGRKRLKEVEKTLTKAQEILEEMAQEEQKKLDNMPESFRYGFQGGEMETAIDYLKEAAQQISDAIYGINEI